MLHPGISSVNHRPFCRGACKKYAVGKPAGKGRYGEGQARCQVCDVWVDAKGARLKDGTVATVGSVGWYCRCCKYRLRTRPRSVRYKSRLGAVRRVGAGGEDVGASSVDLSYFSRLRAGMLQGLAAALPESREDLGGSGGDYLPADMIRDLENEFGDLGELLDLAYDIDPPNKISLLVEFERVKSNLDRVPTKEEFEKSSSVSVATYDSEFGSWENFLDKLGHDPWYRGAGAADGASGLGGQPMIGVGVGDDTPDLDYDVQGVHDDAATLREKIREILEYDPDALKIFEMMESDIGDVRPSVLRRLAEEVASD